MVTRLNAEQIARNERGLAACRAVVDSVLARREQPENDAAPMTRSDELLAAARQRASALRRLARANTTNPLIRRQP